MTGKMYQYTKKEITYVNDVCISYGDPSPISFVCKKL